MLSIKRIFIGLLGIATFNGYSQCNPANISVTDYCNNQYAEFNINDVDPDTRYQWFNDASAALNLGYGPDADGKYFYSPTTYASGSGAKDFWYQKQVSGVTGGPQTSTFSGTTSGPGGGRTNPISVDSDFDFTLNSVTVPFHFYGTPAAGTSYGVKVSMDGTTSNWHYFTAADLVAGGTNLWFLKIPLDINGLGQGIPVTAGTGIDIQVFSESDGTEAAGTAFLETAVITAGGINDTYTIGSAGSQLTIDQTTGDKTGWPTGRYGIFDWDITMKCPLQKVTANEETDLTKCCTPVTIQPIITTSNGSNIYEVPITGSLSVANLGAGNYFKWFLDGAVFDEGVGKTTVNITDKGKYTVVVSEKLADIDKQSCGSTSIIKKIRDKKLFIAPTDTTFLCIGESVALSSTGGLSDWQWSTTGGGNVDNPTSGSTNWTPNAEGVYKVAIEAMVPEGELIVNGDFEAGATGFDVSTKMREAPWGDVTTQNVSGCGTGPNLVFRNYGISGNGNGVYTVGTSAPLQDVWCFNGGVKDHTTGTGNFFMMDGLTGAGWQDLDLADNYIWQQKVVVEKNVDYNFGAWFASLDNGGPTPPKIKFFIDGVEITIIDPLNYSENWDETSATWNSGNYEGEITLSILNATNADGGNDIAMDDISFSSGNALQSDTTIVKVITCVDPCVKPTSVTIANDTLKICDLVNYTHTAIVIEGITPLDDYYYSWYKDGVVITNPTTTIELTSDGVGAMVTSNGWYRIRVEDGDNADSACYLEDSIYLSVNPIPEPDLGNDTTICFGETIDLDAGSGPGPGDATYAWSPTNETTQGIIVTSSGIYEVTVTTSIGCEETDEIEITVNPEVIVDLGANDTICDGADILIDAGVGFDSYVWFPNSEITSSITVSTTGDYSVVVEDDIGCSDTDTVHIEVKEIPTVDLGQDITVCEGPIELNAGASVIGQTYLWNTTETTQTIGVNENGTNEYSVLITNWECEARDTINVTIDSVLSVDFGPDTTVCLSDLPVTLIADAGYATYTWTDDVDLILGSLQAYSAVSAGEYRVIVIDPSGCTGYDTINVITNPIPDATINNGIDTITICATSPAVTLTAVETGADYLWSPNGETTQSVSYKVEDWYSVIVTSNGCTDEDSIYIEIANELKVDIGLDVTVCPGVEAQFFTSFAGFNHDWNNGTSVLDTFKTTLAGEIVVHVSDAGGCEGRDTVEVFVENPLKIDLGLDRSICVNHDEEVFGMLSNRIDVTVITWSDASTDLRLTTGVANKYWLEVDSAGCLARDTVELFVNELPVLDLGKDTFICTGTGETIPLDAGDNFETYTWSIAGSGSTQTINALDSGLYKVEVIDSNTCVNSDSMYIELKIATLFELFGGADDTTICPLGMATIDLPIEIINANNPVYTWLNDGVVSNGLDVIVNNKADGDIVGVSLSLVNEFGCLSEDTFTVFVENYLPIDLKDEVICIGDDVIFDSKYLTTGYTFIWNTDLSLNGNTWSVNNSILTDSGNVSVSIVSDEGCSGDTTVYLTVNPLPEPILRDTSICVGESTVFDHGVGNVITSVWFPNGETTNTVTGDENTNYKVIVTDVNGCTDSASANLTIDPLPVFTITQMPDEACIGEEIDLSTGLGNGYTFVWTPTNETTSDITVSQDDTYGVTVTNTLTTCESSSTYPVVFKPYPVAIIQPDTDTAHICEDESITLLPNNTQYTVSWLKIEDGSVYGSGNINTSSAGTYILNVDNDGCDAEDTIYVDVHVLPQSPLGTDTVACFLDDDPIVLNASRAEGTYVWNTGATISTISVSTQGIYVVEVTNEWGCEVSDDIFVDDDCPSGVYLPNSFTPNGDGLNDGFVIQGHNLISVEVMVFDRWGMHLWTGNSIGDFWDGTYADREVQVDVYVWKMWYSYENSDEAIERKEQVGTVTVIK